MKIIHTADVHLGAKLNFLGDKASLHRENIASAFAKSISIAIEAKADIFLLGGDLFDSNHPAQASVLFAIRELKKIVNANIYLAIIPGNHDLYNEDSVYRLPDWQSLFNNKYCHFFNSEVASDWYISELDTVITGAAITKKRSSKSQLIDIPKKSSDNRIGLFHGSVDIKGEPANFPLAVQDMKKLDFDYIALGDWHNQLMVVNQNPCTWYSGSPELIASDQDRSGTILEVIIDKHQVQVNSLKVGSINSKKISLDISMVKSHQDLIDNVIQQVEDAEHSVVELELTGVKQLDNILDEATIIESLRQICFYANVIDNSKLKLSAEQIAGFAKNSVVSNYIEYFELFKIEHPEDEMAVSLALEHGLQQLLSKAKS